MTDRERLRELALSVAPGPWRFYGGCITSDRGVVARSPRITDQCAPGSLADADYIAAVSPSVVLGLLVELEEAERAVRDTFLAINHKAVKTAESRTVERLAMQWRPIETAPTDGSWILLARSDNGFVGEGYRTRTFATFAANGFRIDDVTHWMPLPAPPEADR